VELRKSTWAWFPPFRAARCRRSGAVMHSATIGGEVVPSVVLTHFSPPLIGVIGDRKSDERIAMGGASPFPFFFSLRPGLADAGGFEGVTRPQAFFFFFLFLFPLAARDGGWYGKFMAGFFFFPFFPPLCRAGGAQEVECPPERVSSGGRVEADC